MTVQELLIKEGFDNIMKALQTTHKRDRSIEDVAGYKEAFDIICNTQFEGGEGVVDFDVTAREHWDDPHSLPLLANNVEGELFRNVVGLEVVRPTEYPFTDAELAGAILWGMTFYGFTQRDRGNCFHSMMDTSFTEYGKMARRLMAIRELPYADLPGMRESLLEEMDNMSHPFGLKLEEWEYLRKRKRHLNRSKRKRDYRLKKRISWLKKLDKRQNDINTIKKGVGSISTELTNAILRAGSIMVIWRESHTYGKSPRVDYIIDLLSLYQGIKEINECCDRLLVVCYTSSNFPISEEEKGRIKQYINDNVHCAEKEILFGTDDEVSDGDIALQFIGIHKTIIDDDE